MAKTCLFLASARGRLHCEQRTTMVKCKSCKEELCELKYENRHKCDDPSNCTCTCQEEPATTFWKGFGSIALGVAAFTGGVALTVTTGGLGLVGLAAAAGGGALTGVGATAAIHPIAKKMSGERMTGEEYVKDLAIGATVGAVTGPIGAGGASATTSIASKVGTEGIKQGAVKLGCRTAVGAVSGATASAIQEGVNAATDDDASFSVMNVLKGAAVGAATGGLSHVSSNISGKVSSEVTRSIIRVATDTAGSAGIDVSSQLIENGEVDGKRLALNIGARAATSAGYEAVASATYAAHGGKEALKDKLGEKHIIDNSADEGDKQRIAEVKEYAKNLSPEIQKQLELADGRKLDRAQSDHQAMKEDAQNLVQEIKNKITEVNQKIQQVKNDPQLSKDELPRTMKVLHSEKNAYIEMQKAEQADANARLESHQKNVVDPLKPKMMGPYNFHALGRGSQAKVGQLSADLPDPDFNSKGERGLRRAIFDTKPKAGGTFDYILTSIVNNHDYNAAPGYGEVKPPELNECKPYTPLKDEKKKKKKKD